LPKIDYVIHHGGAGILYSCIKYNKPAVIIPHDYDQFDYGVRADLAKIGIVAKLKSKDYFVADCMFETISRSNLKRLKAGDEVNLEKSITLATPLGGHLVTGDVDCEGEIVSITQEGIAKIYEIKISRKYMRYIVEKGRATIDGASLTVISLTDDTFSVSLIPHTQEKIILGSKKVGDIVNIETDLVGKYIERFVYFDKLEEKGNKKSKITREFLLENGF